MTGIETIAALAVASTAVSAASAVSAGQQQAAMANHNADIQRVSAGTALASSEADAARIQDRTRRTLATGVNNQAGSGVDPTTGSPLDVMSDMAAQGSLDSQIAEWKGRQGAAGLEDQAGVSRLQAGQAATAGYMQAGSTLLGGAARAGSMYTSMAGRTGGGGTQPGGIY
jgi:hypothetical protein